MKVLMSMLSDRFVLYYRIALSSDQEALEKFKNFKVNCYQINKSSCNCVLGKK